MAIPSVFMSINRRPHSRSWKGVTATDLIQHYGTLANKRSQTVGNLLSPTASLEACRIGMASKDTYQMACKERMGATLIFPILKKGIWFITALCTKRQSSDQSGPKPVRPLFWQKKKKNTPMSTLY